MSRTPSPRCWPAPWTPPCARTPTAPPTSSPAPPEPSDSHTPARWPANSNTRCTPAPTCPQAPGPTWPNSPTSYAPSCTAASVDTAPAAPAEPANPTAAAPDEAKLTLLLVSADTGLAGRVTAEAAARGIGALVSGDCAAARQLADHQRPDVVVLDVDLPGEEHAALALLSDLATGADPVPVACVADADAFDDRVQLARRGARGHLSRALPAATLIATARSLLDAGGELGQKVLVVDDDPALLEVVAALLRQRGLQVVTLADPTRFWETLETCCPQLVLLDVDMPHVDGIQLCRVMRNDPQWTQVPVLFLTASLDRDTIQRIFTAGADDYVTKPVLPVELSTRITNRLERVALYRNLADTDALTGVATRRASTEALTRTLRLAAREGRACAVAIIDIDHFKAVNDQHGHPVGDQVLQRLGMLLRTGFRSEDIVARWGGEEFLVAMFGSTADDAAARITKLLHAFRAERFTGRDATSFTATFSAGVAAAPQHGYELESLYHAADRALYHAKTSGRNRVASGVNHPTA